MDSKTEKSTRLVLDRFEEGKAVLLDGQKEVILDKKYLPLADKEGSTVILSIETDEENTKKREKLAKELLNEILGGK